MRRIYTLIFALIIALGCNWIESAQAVQASGGVDLAWSPSPDTNVAGYYLYYGPATGSYTQRMDVGNTTITTVTGLTPGTTNYFVATSYDAQRLESFPSNEASYIDPGTIAAAFDATNTLHLVFPVAAGHSYDIQYSTTMTNWTTLTTILSATNGVYDFVDTSFTGAVKRFYRLILH